MTQEILQQERQLEQEGLEPYCYEDGDRPSPPDVTGARVFASAYEHALEERLRKVQAEVKLQGSIALGLRQEVDEARAEADANFEELASLRARWAEEQPQREALLRQTGEAERHLAEREAHCAERLARHSASEVEKRGTAATGASGPPASARKGGDKNMQPAQTGLNEQRQKLQTLEALRVELASSLQELRDAVRQEGSVITQLGSRSEALQKERRALRTGAEAAKEGEARLQRKLEALETTSAAGEQRQQALERQVRDLHDEVRDLRKSLASALAVPPTNGLEDAAAQMEEAAWEMNRRLQGKVEVLSEELKRKQEGLVKLRETVSNLKVAGAAAGVL
mmetsp:Transcript_28283/g.51049  ORF Transcript_28283/g.51049 Transcript_28283/m.51049 type:complete len:339 (-) Transcript_28283:71-1087(-)